MDHRARVLLYEPVSLVSRSDGCTLTYVLLLKSIRAKYTLLLGMEGLLSISIPLLIAFH